MATATLFVIAEKFKQPKYLSNEGQLKSGIYAVRDNLAVKGN